MISVSLLPVTVRARILRGMLVSLALGVWNALALDQSLKCPSSKELPLPQVTNCAAFVQ